jgi:hypothetical protein
MRAPIRKSPLILLATLSLGTCKIRVPDGINYLLEVDASDTWYCGGTVIDGKGQKAYILKDSGYAYSKTWTISGPDTKDYNCILDGLSSVSATIVPRDKENSFNATIKLLKIPSFSTGQNYYDVEYGDTTILAEKSEERNWITLEWNTNGN